MDRYVITTTPDGLRVGILDREWFGYCTLMDENKNVLPLEWTSRNHAEAWLRNCYRTWQTWEGSGEGRAPKGWRPHPPEPSPWDQAYYDK